MANSGLQLPKNGKQFLIDQAWGRGRVGACPSHLWCSSPKVPTSPFVKNVYRTMCSGSAVSRWQECFISTALAFPVPLFTLWEPLFSDKTDISFFALKVKTSQITTFGNIFISWTSCDLFVIQANLSKPIFCQVGDAGIVQRSPLKHNGRDSRYKDSPLPVRRYISRRSFLSDMLL